MKAVLVLMTILLSGNAYAAEGCAAYGRVYIEGEQDCDGRVCLKDGTWMGVVKSGICDVTDEQDQAARDPASVKKKHTHTKKRAPKKAKKHR